MALDKQSLSASFYEILTSPQTQNNAQEVANALANAIDIYVKTGNAVGVDSNGDTHNLIIQ